MNYHLNNLPKRTKKTREYGITMVMDKGQIITLQLGDNKIELHNSFWGKETVKVNNQVVSSPA